MVQVYLLPCEFLGSLIQLFSSFHKCSRFGWILPTCQVTHINLYVNWILCNSITVFILDYIVVATSLYTALSFT